MASYVLSGYTTPAGVSSSSDVKTMQQQLGVKADGIWGPVTQAAYDNRYGSPAASTYSSGASTAAAQYTDGLSSFLSSVQSLFSTPQTSYEMQSTDSLKAQLESILRPSVDQAIKSRQEQTQKNRAEIDADALSRGMGRSTYVTDVKDRQMEYEANDIAGMEAQYSAALGQLLMEAVEKEQSRYLEAQKYNQQQQVEANKLALSYAQSAYSDYANKLQSEQSKSAAKSASSSAKATTPENCYRYLEMLNPAQRAAVYSGVTANDRIIRDELIASLGKSGYLEAQQKYPGSE